MKLKIAKIIKNCNDCNHCVFATSINNSNIHFAICTCNEKNNFLLFNGDNPKHYNLEIPEDCPLEDYKGNKIIEKEEE